MVHLTPATIAKGVGVYFAAAAGGYLYLRSSKAPAPSPCGCREGRPDARRPDGPGDSPAADDESGAGGQEAFDRLADCYDRCINLDETVMGIKLMRRWLMRQAEVCNSIESCCRVHNLLSCAQCLVAGWKACCCMASDRRFDCLPISWKNGADGQCRSCIVAPFCPAALQGDVLEVSAGTGRNLPYFRLASLRSLTLTDTSRPMLVNAADKYAAMAAAGSGGAASVRFELADAQQLVAPLDGRNAGSKDGAAGSDERIASRPVEGAQQPVQQTAAQERTQEAQQAAQQQGQQQPGAATGNSPQRPALKEQKSFAPHSFDVVVDTFGLCSQADPVTALKASACFPLLTIQPQFTTSVKLCLTLGLRSPRTNVHDEGP
jgi:hypothetical protein